MKKQDYLTKKGFIVPVLLGVIALIVIGSGVYFYKNEKVKKEKNVNNTEIINENKNENEKTENSQNSPQPNLKTFTVGNLEFSYPDNLTLSKKGETTALEHSISWVHENRCAFTAEDKKILDNLEDFTLNFSLINKNISDAMKSNTPPYDPKNDIEKFSVGSLNGYKVHYNFEACGINQYYFKVSDEKTLLISRPFHVQSAPQQRLSELDKINGFISSQQEEKIFNDILLSVKGLENQETMTIKVYFGDTIDAQSCHTPSYIERIIPKTTAVARAAIEELLKGPTDAEKLQDYWTGLRPGISIKSISIENGVAYLDLSSTLSLNDSNKGTCGATIVIKQIENTLKQFSTIKSVVIKVNGQPAENSIDP